MKIYRSALLRFADDGQAVYDSDALLAIAPDAAGVQRVVAAGSWQALADQYLEREGVQVIHLPGKLLAPGFVDLHIHYPQTDVIGAPAPGRFSISPLSIASRMRCSAINSKISMGFSGRIR